MAQSRLEKIGTIYTRVKGLLEAGAMKSIDRPTWYDVYEAFPPRLEPRFDRPAPNIQLRDIFYAEDAVRAQFHKNFKRLQTCNLLDDKLETQTQQFIKIYDNLKSQGALDEEQVFKTALELFAEQSATSKYKTISEGTQMKKSITATNLDAATEHKGAKETHEMNEATVDSQLKQKRIKEKSPTETVNIKNLFDD